MQQKTHQLPLRGLKILITRPEQQSAVLIDLVRAAGGIALPLPLLNITASDKISDGVQLLNSPLDWDDILFTSKNAVHYAVQNAVSLVSGITDMAKRPRFIAIGEATAQAMTAAGLPVDIKPTNLSSSSEALLELPTLKDVTDRKILLVCGEDGRELLQATLTERGGSIQLATVYKREIATSQQQQLHDWWLSGSIDLVVLTSTQSLTSLEVLLGKAHHEKLKETPLAVISDRLQMTARNKGYNRIAVASTTNDSGLLEALVSLSHNVHIIPNKETGTGDNAVLEEDTATAETSNKAVQSDARPPESLPRAAESGPPGKKGGRLIAWAGYTILLLVAILAASSYWILQELRSRQEGLGGELNKGDQQMLELGHQISGLQSQLATLQSQYASMQTALNTEDSKLERVVGEQSQTMSSQINDVETDLKNDITQIQRQLNTTRGNVLIADAEYLLGIANQKLHMVGDIASVLATLAAADQRLRDSGDPAVYKVREALAKETDLLEGFKSPDLVGISSQLLSMEAKIAELPLLLPHSEVAREAVHKPLSEEHAPHPDNMNKLDQALAQLRGLVTVRRTDQSIEAILLPEEVQALRQVLLLKLEMSRASLMRGDDALFQANLESARKWLTEHFDHDTALVKGLADELDLLATQPLRPNFPDISASLSLLRNIEKLRMESDKNRIEPAAKSPGGGQ